MAAVVLPVPPDGGHRGLAAILSEPELAGQLSRGLESLAEAMASHRLR